MFDVCTQAFKAHCIVIMSPQPLKMHKPERKDSTV